MQALKGAPKGIVKIGVAKPLPMADTSINNVSQNQSDNSNVSTDPNANPDWKMK